MKFVIVLLACFVSIPVFSEYKTTQKGKSLSTFRGYRGKKHTSRTIKISAELEEVLSSVVSGMVTAHRYLTDNNMVKFREQIQTLLDRLYSARPVQDTHLTYHQRAYLNLQLSTIEENMRFMMVRQANFQGLKKIYRDLVQISQTYDLNSQEYGVYFCPRDRNVWIQEASLKTYNPFGQGYKNCGRKIR